MIVLSMSCLVDIQTEDAIHSTVFSSRWMCCEVLEMKYVVRKTGLDSAKFRLANHRSYIIPLPLSQLSLQRPRNYTILWEISNIFLIIVISRGSHLD